MLRRSLLTLVPALMALAFLCGTPATGMGGPEVSATSGAGSATALGARGTFTQDVADIAVNQSADEDDAPDDRIVRVVTPVIWPDSALAARILHASDRAGDRHRPCAAPARAPPSA
jgi:hypothetical protein